MTQNDYILGIAEDVGRALAQIIYHKEIQDYRRLRRRMNKKGEKAGL